VRSKSFATLTALALVVFTTGCYTPYPTRYGTYLGGHSTVSRVNGAQRFPGDKECWYWYRISLYEQCERARYSKEFAELGADVALNVASGVLQAATRGPAGVRRVWINPYIQRSYTYCSDPPRPPHRH